MNTKYYIGIDGGGTKTDAIITDSNHNILAKTTSGSCNINNNVEIAYQAIIQVINDLTQQIQISNKQISGIGIGVAGYSNKQALTQLQTKLNSLSLNIVISSDCEIAHLAAFNQQDGAIIICGTGVVGYYKQNKIATQIGGWGFPQGDLGGGANLGLELCKLLCQQIDNLIPSSLMLDKLYAQFNYNSSTYKEWLFNASAPDFASLTSYIFMNLNDIYADQLIKHGIKHLSLMLNHLNSLALPIKLYGGLASSYLPYLIKAYPQLSLSTDAPAIGAINLIDKTPTNMR